MKLIINLLLIQFIALGTYLLFFNQNLKAQETSFEINFETNYDEVPNYFVLNKEGDFIGLVRKAPPTDSTYIYDNYLYRITQNGDSSSIKYTKEDTVFTFYYINRLSKNTEGFLLTGWGYNVAENQHYPFIIIKRIDNDLNPIWEKTFRINYYFGSSRSSVLELSNGNLVYACSPELNQNMFLLKLGPDGDSLNFKHFTGNQSGEVFSITYNPDSSNIWLHNLYAYYQGTGNSLCSSIILNNKLEQIGVKHYPEDFTSPFNSIYYNDSLILTGGSNQRYNLETHSFELELSAFILDSSFNIKHDVFLTDPDTNSRGAFSNCIDFYYPNSIYLGGTYNIQDILGIEPSWIYISKLNDTLGVEYEKYIGGDDYYVLFSVTAAKDGGVLLTGTKQEAGTTYLERDGFILKLDSNGILTSVTKENNVSISDAIVYPNPGSSIINIRTALKGCVFNLYDNWGRQILTRPLLNNITSISTNTLSTGNYHYSINNKDNTINSGIWIKN